MDIYICLLYTSEGIVVLAAGMAGCFGTVTKLHSLNGTDGHNGLRQIGIQRCV